MRRLYACLNPKKLETFQEGSPSRTSFFEFPGDCGGLLGSISCFSSSSHRPLPVEGMRSAKFVSQIKNTVTMKPEKSFTISNGVMLLRMSGVEK